MIDIKKLICAAVLLPVLLCLSGCSGSTPARPQLELSGAGCTIRYGKSRCTASVTNTLGGLTTVSFSSPESLEGLCYSFTPQGCRITFGELSAASDSSQLGSRAVPQLLHSVMKDASSDGALTPGQASQNGTAQWSGSAEGISYTLETDAATGRLLSLRVKDPPVSAEFVP